MNHRDCSINSGRANTHRQVIACARSFDVGLMSADGKKARVF
jgi:hypothetical protein